MPGCLLEHPIRYYKRDHHTPIPCNEYGDVMESNPAPPEGQRLLLVTDEAGRQEAVADILGGA